MKCEKIFQKIDELNQEYIKVWEDVCNLESPTNDKAAVDAVGSYFIERAKARGWEVEICEQPVSGNAVSITMNPALCLLFSYSLPGFPRPTINSTAGNILRLTFIERNHFLSIN